MGKIIRTSVDLSMFATKPVVKALDLSGTDHEVAVRLFEDAAGGHNEQLQAFKILRRLADSDSTYEEEFGSTLGKIPEALLDHGMLEVDVWSGNLKVTEKGRAVVEYSKRPKLETYEIRTLMRTLDKPAKFKESYTPPDFQRLILAGLIVPTKTGLVVSYPATDLTRQYFLSSSPTGPPQEEDDGIVPTLLTRLKANGNSVQLGLVLEALSRAEGSYLGIEDFEKVLMRPGQHLEVAEYRVLAATLLFYHVVKYDPDTQRLCITELGVQEFLRIRKSIEVELAGTERLAITYLYRRQAFDEETAKKIPLPFRGAARSLKARGAITQHSWGRRPAYYANLESYATRDMARNGARHIWPSSVL